MEDVARSAGASPAAPAAPTPRADHALDAVVAAALVRFGLAGDTASLLTYSENRTYLVRNPATGAPDAALRLCRSGYHTRAELEAEVAWLHAIAAAGIGSADDARFAVVRPMPGVDGACVQEVATPAGQTYRCVATAHLAGRAADEGGPAGPVRAADAAGPAGAVGLADPAGPAGAAGPAGRADAVDPAGPAALNWLFNRVGELAARLHTQAQNWPSARTLERGAWTYRTTIGAQAAWGTWRAFEGFLPHDVRLLERCAATIEQRLARYGRTAQNFGLIHADMRLANLLVDGDRVGLLDFDDCGFGWHMFDLAASLSFIEAHPAAEALADAWVAGYRRVRPLADVDVAETPTFVMMRRLQLTGWLASRADADPAPGFSHGWATDTLALAERYCARFS